MTATSTHPAITSRARGNLILGAMMCSTFLFVLTEGLPHSLLVHLAPGLNVTTSEIGLLVTGYALMVVFGSVPLALLTKRAPRRWVLTVVIAVAGIATGLVGFANSYPVVLAGRLVTGLAQAMFWIAVLPGTTGLFPPAVRGRVIARLALGNSLAPLLGLPAVNWIAEHFHWRAAFWAVSALAFVVLVLVTALFPSSRPGESARTAAVFPNRRRFMLIQAEAILMITGGFAMVTFMTQLLTDVSGYRHDQLAALLFVTGFGAVAGALLIARFLDAHPWTSLLVTGTVMGAALLSLGVFGSSPLTAVVLIAVFGLGLAATAPIFSHRALMYSPWGMDVGQAIQSGTFNIGIASGSALGAGLTAALGVRSVALVGAGLAAAGLAVALIERRACGPEPHPPASATR